MTSLKISKNNKLSRKKRLSRRKVSRKRLSRRKISRRKVSKGRRGRKIVKKGGAEAGAEAGAGLPDLFYPPDDSRYKLVYKIQYASVFLYYPRIAEEYEQSEEDLNRDIKSFFTSIDDRMDEIIEQNVVNTDIIHYKFNDFIKDKNINTGTLLIPENYHCVDVRGDGLCLISCVVMGYIWEKNKICRISY